MLFPFKMLNNIDPTRTLTIRRNFEAAISKRFRELFDVIYQSIIKNDCFGIQRKEEAEKLRTQQVTPVPFRKFDFATNERKIEEFMKWLQEQQREGVLDVVSKPRAGGAIQAPWTYLYLDSAYQKGIRRGRAELRKQGVEIPSFGIKDEVSAVFSQPFHVDRVGVIYTRNYTALKNITSTMDARISSILADGLASGIGADQLARNLKIGVEPMTFKRAGLLARTETINAHHKATVQEYRNAQIAGVKIKAEFDTAHDERVCPICRNLDGKKMSLEEVEDLIPVHPNCRCVALPDVEEDIEPVIPPEPTVTPKPRPTPRPKPVKVEPQKPTPSTPIQEPTPMEPKIPKKVTSDKYTIYRNVVLDSPRKIRAAVLDVEKQFRNQEHIKKLYKRGNEVAKELNTLTKEFEKLGPDDLKRYEYINKLNALKKEGIQLSEIVSKEGSKIFEKVLNAPSKEVTKINFEWEATTLDKSKVNEEINIFKKWITSNKNQNARNCKILYYENAGRASFQNVGDRIILGPNFRIGTVAHETGHYIERNFVGVKQKAINFLKKRTEGGKIRHMGNGYDNDEFYKEDKFPNNYCGKLMTSIIDDKKIVGTEIISMGLDFLVNDPVKFARQDPEYFDFMMEILKGM